MQRWVAPIGSVAALALSPVSRWSPSTINRDSTMKKIAFFLLWTLLSVSAFAQQAGKYSTDVQVVSVSSVKNTVTLCCSGLGDNKKEALVMAQKSALYTLLHVGVEGVNNGQPLWAIVDEDYDRRMFEEDRYATVVANCQDLGKYTKENGRVRAEVEATFYLRPLMKAAGVVGANVGTVARTNLPSITIVPFVRQDENQMEVLEGNSMNRVAASSVEMMFSKRGYLTKNYKTMIQNLQNNDILLQGSQSEAVEKMLQNAGTDVKVLVRCNQSVGSTGIVTVTVEMTAVEAFTSTTLASTKLIGQNRGDSLLVLEQTINAKANQQQRNSFFQQLQNAFNAIAINGLEVELNLLIDQNVDDFSFEDELDNGAIFKDAFEAWLRQMAVNGNERISMSSEKYLGATLRVPYFDEKGQSYKTSGFHAALRKQMAELLGDDHLAKIDVMGQKVIVTIQ